MDQHQTPSLKKHHLVWYQKEDSNNCWEGKLIAAQPTATRLSCDGGKVNCAEINF